MTHTDTDIVVDPLLWFIDKLKDQSNRQDLNKVMLDFYKEETILASKICLHEKQTIQNGVTKKCSIYQK